MKPIIFCGFQNSGKTLFIQKAIRGLKKSGFSVSTVKHFSETFEQPPQYRDTERFLSEGAEISIAVSDKEFFVQKREIKQRELREKIHHILSFLHTDFVLIEGFKTYTGPIPRIVFGHTMEEVENLVDDLTIGYTGISLPGAESSIKGILLPGERVSDDGSISRKIQSGANKIHAIYKQSDKKTIFVPYIPFNIGEKEISSFLNERSFPFPGDIDCGECGFPDCREFAKMILKGKKSPEDCIPLKDDVQLYINEKRVSMKGFVKSILKGTIAGFVRELKEYEEGEIRVLIKK